MRSSAVLLNVVSFLLVAAAAFYLFGREDLPPAVGGLFFVLSVAVLTMTAFLAQGQKTRRALRESREQMQLFALATNDLLWNWDHVTGVVERNAAFETTFGYSPDEISTNIEWWIDRLHPDDRERVLDTYQEAVDTGQPGCSYEYRFRRRDGSYATVEDRVRIVRDKDGSRVRSLGAMTDVTEKRRLASQLRQAQKMEALGRLAGGIAHDFNNQLTAILMITEGAVDKLEEGLSEEVRRKVRDDLEHVVQASQQAAEMTEQLLAFSRKQVVKPHHVDLNRFVAEAEKTLGRLIGEHIEMAVQVAEEPAWVYADSGQLNQVLMNLVINAAEAMPRKGRLDVEVRTYDRPPSRTLLDSAWAETILANADGFVVLTVHDSGEGIPGDMLSRVFEPFFTTKQDGKGTGLGLATVYGLVRQMGGQVTVDSEEDAGSTFTVLLPLVPPPEKVESSDSSPSLPAVEGLRVILLCEDNPAVRRVTSLTLVNAGYKVLEAARGTEAIAQAEAHEGPIHVLLTDVVMPGMNGRELAETLLRQRPEMQVLFMSGYTADVLDSYGIDDLDADILQKPFRSRHLRRRIRAIFGEDPDTKA